MVNSLTIKKKYMMTFEEFEVKNIVKEKGFSWDVESGFIFSQHGLRRLRPAATITSYCCGYCGEDLCEASLCALLLVHCAGGVSDQACLWCWVAAVRLQRGDMSVGSRCKRQGSRGKK